MSPSNRKHYRTRDPAHQNFSTSKFDQHVGVAVVGAPQKVIKHGSVAARCSSREEQRLPMTQHHL